eukprot:COSAG01_NODE_1524_length_10019_cov_6.258367_18_plen_122_part_00
MEAIQAKILAVELQASRAAAALTLVNCLENPLGDEGLATLVTAVEASSIGSICGLTEGQTIVDWSELQLGPFDCKIIAADLGLRRFSAAAVKKVVLPKNVLLISKLKYGDLVHDIDADQSG